MDILAAFNRIFEQLSGVPWEGVYYAAQFAFIGLDIVLVVAIAVLSRRALSYRMPIDMHAVPPGIEQILKRAGLREQYATAWQRVREKASANPPDSYRIAIMDADALIDRLIQDAGFSGNTTAERFGKLNGMGIRSLDKMFRAHRIRNELAHTEGFAMAPKDAEEVLGCYESFLTEAKIL